MTYQIIRKHLINEETHILMQFDTETDGEARMWFTSAIATMLEEDISGEYRMVSLEDFAGSPPTWYKGDGFYDSHDHLVLHTGQPFIDQIVLDGWRYYLEQQT